MNKINYSVQIDGDKSLFKTLTDQNIKYETLLFDGFDFVILEVGNFDNLNDAINRKEEFKNKFSCEIVKYINDEKDESFNDNGFLSNSIDPRDFLLGDHDIVKNADEDLYEKSYDLRDKFMPEVFDQKYGSCTAQATVASYWYQVNRLYDLINIENQTKFSRAYTYLMTRYMHNGISIEDGSIRDACKSIKRYGVADERHFPSNSDFNDLPDFHTMAYAISNKIDSYYLIGESDNYLLQILACLDNKIPVIVGMNSDMFRDARNNGISEKALKWNEKNEANHALLIVGRIKDFDYLGEKRNVIVIRNSWGDDWGDKGYFYIPEDQLVKYGISDVMVIIKDEFTSDEPNFEFKITKHDRLIPNKTLIYKEKAYSLLYLNKLSNTDNNKFHEIYDPILKDYKNAYTKRDGKITDIDGNEIQVSFPIFYTGNNGESYIIE